jgi:hypothetical protein
VQATSSSRNILAPAASLLSNPLKPGVLKARTVTSVPPASPRISCNSSFWAALTQGGLKRVVAWVKRKGEYQRLSIAERKDKPLQAAYTIRIALKDATSNPASLTDGFNKYVEVAHWYEVDVDAEIHSALSLLNNHKLSELKNACAGKAALNWLAQKVDERIGAVNRLKDRLNDDIYKSAVMFSEGHQLNNSCQKELWQQMDEHFESIGDCHLESHVANQFSEEKFSWKWLPFVEAQSAGMKIKSKSLSQVCIQATKKLAESRTIDFKKLMDVELSRLLKLSERIEFKHLGSECKAEWNRRTHISKRVEMSSYLGKRLSLLAASAPINKKTDESLFAGLSDAVIGEIISEQIGKLSPKELLSIATRESDDSGDKWLIDVVKSQLRKPKVALMNDAVLVQYLELPQETLSSNARDLVLQEVEERALTAVGAGLERFKAGLQQNSCGFMVRAVLDFSACFERAVKLYSAAGLQMDTTKVFKNFWSGIGGFRDMQLVLARNLESELIANNQERAAVWLRRAIYGVRTKELPPKFDKKREISMRAALSHYLPPVAPSTTQPSVTRAGIELGKKFLDLLNMDSLVDINFRMVRTANGEEIPVCEQFVLDQRSTDLQYGNNPIFSSHIKEDSDRARNFVALMHDQTGGNKQQIMMASRIANQSTGATLVKLIKDEEFFSITEAEAKAEQVAYSGMGLGFIPLGLNRQTSFMINGDGSLTVQVRLFNENIEYCLLEGHDPKKFDPISVQTAPDQSSFSAALKFEVDTQGKIREVIIEKLEFERVLVSVQ